MSCEEGRIRDEEDSTSCLCSIIFSRITPFEDFTDISGTTHPNLASDSHIFEAVSHASSSPVIDQAIFPFISYFSHDESLCFRFITHFLLIYHLIRHALTIFVIWQYFLECSLTHALTHFLTHVEMLLSRSCLLLYIKRLSCLRERTI